MLRGTDTEMASDACALAVQALCIAMLSFGQAHIGEIDPFFLEHSLSRVLLYGTRGRLSTEASILFELVDLTCAGDMIDSRAMAFSLITAHADGYHDLTITPKDLLNIWGPGSVTPYQHSGPQDPPPGKWSSEIAIRGGVLYKPTPDSSKMHWKSGKTAVARRVVPFEDDLERPIVVGADPMINVKCPTKPDPYHNTVVRTNISTFIQELGTWPERWSLREMQIGSQAGQYLNATFNATWIKSDSRTRKQKGLEEVDLDFLNKPWGLLLSLCTGVAWRVAIREVVAEVMLPIMDAWMDKPVEGQALLSIGDGLLKELKKPNFRAWVDALQNSEQHALRHYSRHVLGQICWTGVNDAADLVVSCPAFDNSDGCIHVPMKESRALACILKDTERSATFACLTNTCFCVEPYVCRNVQDPHWQNRVSVLVTSVCQYQWMGANDWVKLPQTELQERASYWMGPNDGKRRVKLYSTSCKSDPPSLRISDSSVNWRFYRRIWERLDKMRDETHIELRERTLMTEDYAKEVIIHDEAAIKRKKK